MLQPVENVLPQSGLVIVDKHGRRDVHRRNENEALADVRGGAAFLDFIGDVDDLLTFLRVEGQVAGVGFHTGCFPASSRACHESSAFSSNLARHSPRVATVGSNTLVVGKIVSSALSAVKRSRSTD